MKITGVTGLLASAIFSLVLFSCQKELSYGPAVGNLLDTAGACKDIVVNGVFKADSLLSRGNYLDIQVNVIQPGTYYIYSDTVNGFYFKAAGSFSKTGEATVRLAGFGRPRFQAQGNLFTIYFNQSRCNVAIPVLPADAAVDQFAFQVAINGACISTVQGPYIKAQQMNAGNFMIVNVFVNKTGPYLITSDTLNGIHFTTTGNFTNTGAQVVELNALGTPIDTGTYSYTLSGGGNSSCPVTIQFTSGAVVSNDYFPLNNGSYWTYDSDETSPDTLFKYSRAIVAPYSVFDIGAGTAGINAFGKAFFRKSGSGDYYQKISVDTFTTLSANPNFNNYQELMFLRQNIQGSNSWQSAIFYVTIPPSNDTASIQYDFSQIRLVNYLTARGDRFNDVIRVNCIAKVKLPGAAGFLPNTNMEAYYSKGVGLIEFRKKASSQTNWDLEETLRTYKIN